MVLVFSVFLPVRSDLFFHLFLADVDKKTQYANVVKALCKKNKIPVIEIYSAEKLGRMAGLIRFKATDGSLKRVVKTGCIAITKWYPSSNVKARAVIQEWIAESKSA